MTLTRSKAILAILYLACTLPGLSQTQQNFSGHLDGKLHTSDSIMGPVIFDAITPVDEKLLDISVGPGDKIFSGYFSLPKNGVLKFKAVVVRPTAGDDTLYVDLNRDGQFEPQERIPLTVHNPPVDYVKESATFDVSLPNGPFKTSPMEVKLLSDNFPTPAGPNQLAVGYTSSAFVEGYAQLAKRKMLVRFEYDFATQNVALDHALELLDLNGDGKLDMTPGNGEFIRARGSAPVFRVNNLTLQLQSIDLEHRRFIVRSVPDSMYQRIQLSVGSTMPDFEFTDFSGVQHHLSDVKGKYRLLDFWAVWCAPCVRDLPIQKKVYEEFHDRGFNILGMNGDDTLDKPERLLLKEGIHWQQAKLDKHLYEDQFQISLWPTKILLDEHNVIISMGDAKHLPLDGEHLADSLKSLISEKR